MLNVCLRWNKWVTIDDSLANNIWNGRSEVVQRLLAQKCEICGATDNIEVHHIRKLVDIKPHECQERPEWSIFFVLSQNCSKFASSKDCSPNWGKGDSMFLEHVVSSSEYYSDYCIKYLLYT
ncbi:hypothetical protein [Nostoc sp. DedQUE09]|uniref:HNH endonuclease n=1 Tax=Nostoc sp. DedQUE09 TaxID=3075394 RepID=UPI003A1031C0